MNVRIPHLETQFLLTALRFLKSSIEVSIAKKINIDKLWVKDESKRFNLNAFKVLGASFAFAKYILGDVDSLNYEDVLKNVKQVTNGL